MVTPSLPRPDESHLKPRLWWRVQARKQALKVKCVIRYQIMFVESRNRVRVLRLGLGDKVKCQCTTIVMVHCVG